MSVKDYREARRVVEKREAKKGFLCHLVIYLVFNAVIFPVYNLVVVPEKIWFHWPLIF